MFDSFDLMEEEYVSRCLLQSGVNLDPQLIIDYTKKLPKNFHLQYLNRIFPSGVEIMDQNPTNYITDTDQYERVSESLRVVTADYHDIKARIIATPNKDPEKRIPLLLIDYLKEVDRLADEYKKYHQGEKPVIMVVGPGKGEELKHFCRKGYCLVVVDKQSNELLAGMFEDNFPRLQPEISTSDQCSFEEYVSRYTNTKQNPEGSILLMGGIDLDQSDIGLPVNSIDISCSSYTLHHSTNLPPVDEPNRFSYPFTSGK